MNENEVVKEFRKIKALHAAGSPAVLLFDIHIRAGASSPVHTSISRRFISLSGRMHSPNTSLMYPVSSVLIPANLPRPSWCSETALGCPLSCDGER